MTSIILDNAGIIFLESIVLHLFLGIFRSSVIGDLTISHLSSILKQTNRNTLYT